jgi:hypothetical protein
MDRHEKRRADDAGFCNTRRAAAGPRRRQPPQRCGARTPGCCRTARGSIRARIAAAAVAEEEAQAPARISQRSGHVPRQRSGRRTHAAQRSVAQRSNSSRCRTARFARIRRRRGPAAAPQRRSRHACVAARRGAAAAAHVSPAAAAPCGISTARRTAHSRSGRGVSSQAGGAAKALRCERGIASRRRRGMTRKKPLSF